MSPAGRATGGLAAGVAIMLVAFNLRPALSTVGPLLGGIQAGTGLGAGGAALLTTLPVLCLGLAGALVAPVIARLGADRGVLLGAVLITLGLGLRGVAGLGPLFLGTVAAALGIGLANILLPALVKRDFPLRSGLMTGVFTMTLCLGAAAGTGLAVPVERLLGGGWAPALGVWALPAAVGVLGWLLLARRGPAPVAVAVAAPRVRLVRDPLAWQVSAFMGLQSALAYALFGWLPLMLQGRGLTVLDAGFVASVATLHQAPGALIAATLAARARDQRAWIAAVVALTLAGFLALAYAPAILRWPAAAGLGFGIGAIFGLGLMLIVLRAPDAATAAKLSAMAQGIGYTLASLGPLGFGLAHDASGGWDWPAAYFCAIGLAALAAGLGAGRDRQVGSPR